MGKGCISVHVFASREALPLKDVEVLISKKINNQKVIMFELVTNVDGNTSVVSLNAPDKHLSLDPENTSILPYEIYDVEIFCPGYVLKIVNNVQVFDQQETILPVEMIPFPQSGTAPSTDQITDIPEHNLFSPESRDNVESPDDSSYILSKVTIPEFIVVHLGRPQDKAENVWISFPDYIKNVASSEIYPTWPENSLRANIYAQISFALNRIFTEWYRSKGYNFQITNSTQYDQKFIKNRNIFESVSRIVDDIFNKYVRKPGTLEPYFTEYCDGKQVTCNGLKQWGTVTLAQQGKTPQQILEYYYGPVNIVTAKEIDGIPQSYPGSVLKLGSKGECVKVIQKQLNRISRNYPNIQRVDIDGVFDKTTENSVKIFQKIFKLSQDGIVGNSTWYKISYIYTSVKRLAELDSEGERPEIKPGEYPGYIIRQGDRGNNVKTIQYILNFLSTFYFEIDPIDIDGIFGARTTDAVKTFQRIYSLSPDGLVGEKTWNKLLDIFKSIREEINLPNDTYPGKVIKYGSTGINVEKVQIYLNAANSAFNTIPKVSVDGIFGKSTENSVKAFQKRFGLDVDGMVGPTTWNSLVDVYYATLNTDFFAGKPLKITDQNSDVRKMQTMLRFISYVVQEINRLSANGVFEKETEKTVIQFQRQFDLPITGVIDELTWYAIVNVFRQIFGDENEDISNCKCNDNQMISNCTKANPHINNKDFKNKTTKLEQHSYPQNNNCYKSNYSRNRFYR
ncbi:MAG: peptidoglycan-binding protein [Oscillospiraceae bacterium]